MKGWMADPAISAFKNGLTPNRPNRKYRIEILLLEPCAIGALNQH